MLPDRISIEGRNIMVKVYKTIRMFEENKWGST
jgi:hypothetical protein